MPKDASAKETSTKGTSKGKTNAYVERWWLTGEESCAHCHGSYSYEIELRCPECDGPTCPHCMLIYTERHACPECVSDSPGDSGRDTRGEKA